MTPSSAPTIWAEGDTLYVQFQSPTTSASSRIHLPVNEWGLKYLVQLLRERERTGPQTIGHKSDPTQFDADAIIEALKRSRPAPAAPKIDLRALGLLK